MYTYTTILFEGTDGKTYNATMLGPNDECVERLFTFTNAETVLDVAMFTDEADNLENVEEVDA